MNRATLLTYASRIIARFTKLSLIPSFCLPSRCGPSLPLTLHSVGGDQGRAQRTEAVEGFPQQPLLPVAHLPVTRADVVGHGEAGHVGEGVFLLNRDGSISGRFTGASAPRPLKVTLTLMRLPRRPITKASSTSQSTSLAKRFELHNFI